MTVDDIIKLAGGAVAISRASQATRKPVGRFAVHRWRTVGIDETHWQLLTALVPTLTVQQIYDANRDAERRRNPKRRANEARPSA